MLDIIPCCLSAFEVMRAQKLFFEVEPYLPRPQIKKHSHNLIVNKLVFGPERFQPTPRSILRGFFLLLFPYLSKHKFISPELF